MSNIESSFSFLVAGNSPGPHVRNLVMGSVTIQDAEVFEGIGLETAAKILAVPPLALQVITGLPREKVEMIVRRAAAVIPEVARNLAPQRHAVAEIAVIDSGCPELNALLGGGVATGQVYEISAASGTAATSFLHRIAVMCALPKAVGGAGSKCAYVDTRRTFDVHLLRAIGGEYNVDIDSILDDVAVTEPTDYEDQLLLLRVASKLVFTWECRLIIIDGVHQLFEGRNEASNDPAEAVRQDERKNFMCLLHNIASSLNCAVLLNVDHILRENCSSGREFAPVAQATTEKIAVKKWSMSDFDTTSVYVVSGAIQEYVGHLQK